MTDSEGVEEDCERGAEEGEACDSHSLGGKEGIGDVKKTRVKVCGGSTG